MATLPRNTFAAGDAIIATDMNTNFTNVEGLINDVLDGTESHGNFTSTGTASLATVNATGTVTAGAFSTTGSVTGSVVATTLTASGDANFDSGTLFVDVSANRVGISDTSPSYKLDVAGETRVTGNVRAEGDLYVGKNGGSDSRIYFYDDNSNTTRLFMWDDSVNRFHFDSNTNIAGTLTATTFSGSGASLTNLDADNISSGTVPTARIPNLSANKITSDTLATARIPNLSANKITSDTLNIARIPDIGASKIDAGTFGSGNYTFPGALTVNGLLNVSSQGKIEFGNSNDQIRYDDTPNEYQFWGDGNQMTRLGTSIIFDTTNGSVVAKSPATGTGNDAEWIYYLGYYFLYRNSSTAAEKENISADLGTHLTADMIDSVVPKMWNRITAPGIPEIGPIADELDAVSPFLAAHGTDANDDQILTGVNKTAWMSLMTLAIQDLRDRMEAVEAA